LCVPATVLVFLTSQRLDSVQEAGACLARLFCKRLFVLAELLTALWPCPTFGRKVTQVKFVVSCFACSLQRTRSNAEYLCHPADKLACRRCRGRTDVLPETSRVSRADRSHSFCMIFVLTVKQTTACFGECRLRGNESQVTHIKGVLRDVCKSSALSSLKFSKTDSWNSVFFPDRPYWRARSSGKFVPVQAVKAYRANGGIAPLILSLGISWR
jgi:hypothetical protein